MTGVNQHGISCTCCIFTFAKLPIIKFATAKPVDKRPAWIKTMAKRLGVNR